MAKAPKKKFYIKAPIIGEDMYWTTAGHGYTPDKNKARQFWPKEAAALKEREPLLELVPV